MKNCKNCGKFHTNKTYCSMECRTNDSTVLLECETCGEEFRKAESQHEKQPGRYCSIKCRYNTEMVELECENCGDTFEKYESQIEHSGSTHCSWECRYEDRGWTGRYGTGWYKQRRRAIKRDEYECRRCGISQEKCRKKYYSGLHVHHMKPYRTFDSDEEAHKMDNLVTLCPPCHREEEGKT